MDHPILDQAAPAQETLPALRPERVALVAGSHIAPIIPQTIEEIGRIANAVIVAGLAPDSYKQGTPKEIASRVIIGIMKGAEIGLPPITALSTIAIINGRPCLWGDGAIALAQRSGVVEYVKEWFTGTENADDWTAHCEIKRSGQTEPYCGTFSVADAKRAHLWGNPKRAPWMLYPQRMLKLRARAWPLRDGFADALAGIAIAEEVQDIPAAPETTNTAFLDDLPPAPQIAGPVDQAASEPAEEAAAEPAGEPTPEPVAETPPPPQAATAPRAAYGRDQFEDDIDELVSQINSAADLAAIQAVEQGERCARALAWSETNSPAGHRRLLEDIGAMRAALR